MGHISNNLKKKTIKIAPGQGERMIRLFNWSIKKAQNDPELFNTYFKAAPYHMINDHSHCHGDCTVDGWTSRSKPLTTNQFEEIKILVDKVISLSTKFIHNHSTTTVESLNNSRTVTKFY